VAGEPFAEGRLDEGRRVASWLLARHPGRRPLRILDIGAGNGGVSLGAANFEEAEVHSLDIVANPHLLALRRRSGVPMRPCVGVGERLPFADQTFDVVLCLETLEHVERPAEMGREIMRVLKQGGECMVTTPARLRFLFGRDPHYGIPGLLLLPDFAQRLVAKHLFGKRDYDVVHIFGSVGEIVRLFPGAEKHEAFWNRPYPSARSRQRDAIWYRFRNLQWDRIVITKR
jgi:SAM-dependent methyltransferase